MNCNVFCRLKIRTGSFRLTRSLPQICRTFKPKNMYLKKIIRIRLPDEITDELNKMKRKSEYIRCAIREKMQRDNILKKEKLPF